MFRRVTSRVMTSARCVAPMAVPMAQQARQAFSSTQALRDVMDYEALQVATVRKPAPSFKAKAVVNGAIEEISLAQYAGKYVVLLFYPLDFTFVCPTEIIAFSEAQERFAKLGAQVLACSVDSPFSHLAWTKTDRKKGGLGEMKIPLVADLTKDLGLLERARRDAGDWIARSPLLAQDGEHLLRRKVLGTYGEALGLGDVG